MKSSSLFKRIICTLLCCVMALSIVGCGSVSVGCLDPDTLAEMENASQEPQGGTSPEEPQGGTTPEEPQGGTTPEEPQGGTTPEEPQGGTTPEEPQSGTTPEEPQSGTTPEEPQGGTTPEEPQGGTTPEEPQGGTTPKKSQDNTLSEEKSEEKSEESETIKEPVTTETELTLGNPPPKKAPPTRSNDGLTVNMSWVAAGSDGTVTGDTLTLSSSEVTQRTSTAKAVLTVTGNFDNAPAGSVVIRIPRSLATDVLNGDGGIFRLATAVPLAPNTSPATSFNYTIDTVNNEIVITNHSVLNGAVSLSAEMEYSQVPTRYATASSAELQAVLTDGAVTVPSNTLIRELPEYIKLGATWGGNSDGTITAYSGELKNTRLIDTLTTGEAQFLLEGLYHQAGAGDIEVRIPGNLFVNKDDTPTGTASIDLPNVSTPDTEHPFYYTVDSETGEFVIRNSVPLDGYSMEPIAVTYSYDWEDDNIDHDNTAEIKGQASLGVLECNSNYLRATLKKEALVPTYRPPSFSSVGKTGVLTKNWNPDWGTEPADSNQYQYVIWTIHPSVYFGSNNMLTWKLTDTLGAPASQSFVAWRYYDMLTEQWVWSNGAIEDIANQEIIWLKNSSEEMRDITVITKVPVADLLTSPQTDVINRCTVTTTNLLDNSIISKDGEGKVTYTYVHYAGDAVTKDIKSTYKHANDEFVPLLNNRDVTYVWSLALNGRFHSLTEGEGDLEGTYGLKSWTLSVEDTGLNSYKTNGVSLPQGQLESADYSINGFAVIDARAFDYVYDETLNTYGEGTTNVAPEKSIIEVFITDAAGVETKYGDIQYKVRGSEVSATGYYFVQGDTIVKFAWNPSNPVPLPENTNKVRVTMTSPTYSQYLNVGIQTTLHPTENVKQILRDVIDLTVQNNRTYQLQVTNTSKSNVYTAEASVYSQTRSALWVMNSALPTSVFSKTMGNRIANTAAGRDEYLVTLTSVDKMEVPYGLSASDMDAVMRPCRTGVFYDLLPAGMILDMTTVKVMDWTGAVNPNYEYTVSLEPNYKGSGRTLAKITVDSTAETSFVSTKKGSTVTDGTGFVVSFKLYNPLLNINVNGKNGYNVAAFRSDEMVPVTDNKYINWTQRAPSMDLDGDGVTDTAAGSTNFRFMNAWWSTSTLVALQAGMTKQAYDERTHDYSNDGVISYGADYSYKLHYQNNTTIESKGIVLYDVLENAYGENGHWKGTFKSIDVSGAEALGIAPVAYYSTVADLDPKNNASQRDLTDTAIWSTTAPADLSTVTAVAVDCSKATDNNDFVLPASEDFDVFVHMEAPEYYENCEDDKAYNRGMVVAETAFTGDSSWSGFEQECNVGTESFAPYEPELTKTANPSSGTQAAPTDVAEGSALTYTLAVKNASVLSAWSSFTVEDVLAAPLTIANVDQTGIRFYYSTAPSVVKTPGEGTGLTVAVNGNKLTFTGDALQTGQTMYITIPVTLPVGVTNYTTFKDINNTATLTYINGVPQELESNTTYHRIPQREAIYVLRKAVDGDATAKELQYEGADTQLYGFEVVLKDASNNIVTADRTADVMFSMSSDAMQQQEDAPFNVSADAEHEGGRKHYLSNGAYIQFSIPGDWSAEIYETYSDPGLDSVMYKATASGTALAESNEQKSVVIAAGSADHDVTMTNTFIRDIGEITKTADPASGTEETPAEVTVGDTINYTVAAKNTQTDQAWSSAVIEDTIPSQLTADTENIQYYLASAPETVYELADSTELTMAQAGNKLTFTYDAALASEDSLVISIPTTVTGAGLIKNTATITDINGTAREVTSNETVHTAELAAVDFSVTKTVTGAFADMTQEFSFTITVMQEDGTTPIDAEELTYEGTGEKADGTIALTDGVGEFSLTHGQGITITDMPADAKVTVEEESLSSIWTTTHTIDGAEHEGGATTGEIDAANESAYKTVAYTNECSLLPTGLSLDLSPLLPMVMASALMISLTVLLIALRTRKRRGEASR